MEFNGIMPTIAAHRGWHKDGAPKNSIQALERAAAGGVDAIELDVRRLGDGTLVVHHDAALADGRLLAAVDRRVLREFPEIPTLDDWARRASELRASALVELKEVGYEAEVVATMRRFLPDERVEYFSFEPDAVRALRRIEPNRPVGLLSRLQHPARTGAELVQDAKAAHATFLGLNVRQTQDDVLRHAAQNDLRVKVWTVDLLEDMWRLSADPRVDTIISDVPDLALRVRNLATHGDRSAIALREGTKLERLAVRLLRSVATMR